MHDITYVIALYVNPLSYLNLLPKNINMADIRNIAMENDEILVNLRVSREEHELLKQNTENILLIPSGQDTFDHTLTTGRLGNSNRIMMPKRILERGGVSTLEKKVPAMLFRNAGSVYLLLKLKKSMLGIPLFEGDDE